MFVKIEEGERYFIRNITWVGNTVLALGGSESAYDVFRRFRGRAPEIDAILRQQGLKR